MRIENSFMVARPPAETWRVLLDVPLIASCVPGAELLSSDNEFRHKGKISVQLGPVALSFKGVAELSDMDPERGTAVLTARGMDDKGRGGANSTSQISIQSVAEGARVCIVTEMQLSGAVAQYGRASGIINVVANEIVAAFSKNLHTALEEKVGPSNAADPGQGAQPPASGNRLGVGLLFRAIAAWLRGLFARNA